jgi:UDP:flavonoid glycosyltransferase YjiC (YdhE family)
VPATKPRDYLFALTDGGGTVPPELGVVRRLVERGHRVTVLGELSMAGQIDAAGAEARFFTEQTGDVRDWETRGPVALARNMADTLLAGPVAAAAAEARGLPYDVLVPNAYPFPARGMPPFGAGLSPMGGPLGRLRDAAFRGGGSRLIDRYTVPRINISRRNYGLAPIEHTWDQAQRASRQLVLTSSAFDFPAELPPNARYVGPVLDDPAWTAHSGWAAPEGDGPLVVVAMSSTFQNQVECLQRIVDALATLPVRGLLTTGPSVPSEAVTGAPNVTVVGVAPHGEAMRDAAVVVTHGGHGTVMKALAAGAPLVVMHHGRDQADNAARVTTRGAGVAISRKASSRQISRAIAEVLANDDARRAAAEFGRVIVRHAASTALIDELERPLR